MWGDESGGIDLALDLGSFEVSLRTGGLGADWATISMSSHAIDEGVERDGNAGLCAIGFDSGGSPVDVSLDGDEGTVDSTVTAASSPDQANRTADPETVVENCSTR